ncbi:MAG: SDR family NAD(P)-dependent oxidoreductase [Kordiimonadaceae bacterium]|nr:SDR family NAD(P)-dependent oxidoreductase [Kordiimonadaceae bacterium]
MTKQALITGGNRGLGLEVCKALAGQGVKILMGCRDIMKGREIAASIPGDVEAVYINLSNSSKLRAQAKAVLRDYGPIDILVNNGAILKNGAILDAKRKDFYDSVQVNLVAAFDLIQIIVPGMVERGYGRIVNVTSDWGSFADGLTGPVSYSVTKAALNALTMNMAHSMPDNVKVNSVHPGWLKTEMGGAAAPLTAADGAETVVWLATLPDAGPNGGFYHLKTKKAW